SRLPRLPRRARQAAAQARRGRAGDTPAGEGGGPRSAEPRARVRAGPGVLQDGGEGPRREAHVAGQQPERAATRGWSGRRAPAHGRQDRARGHDAPPEPAGHAVILAALAAASALAVPPSAPPPARPEAEVHDRNGVALGDAGQTAAALAEFREAVRLDP